MDAALHAKMHDEVQAEIDRLKAAVRRLEAVADYHRERSAPTRRAQPDNGGLVSNRVAEAMFAGQQAAAEAQRSSKRFAGMTHKDAAFTVLREAKRPMTAVEIVERLQAGGMAGERGRMRKSVSNAMTRATSAFKKAGVGLWELTPEAIEADSPAKIEMG